MICKTITSKSSFYLVRSEEEGRVFFFLKEGYQSNNVPQQLSKLLQNKDFIMPFQFPLSCLGFHLLPQGLSPCLPCDDLLLQPRTFPCMPWDFLLVCPGTFALCPAPSEPHSLSPQALSTTKKIKEKCFCYKQLRRLTTGQNIFNTIDSV